MTMPKQRPGLSKQNYETPQEFVDLVKGRLKIREFTVDLAADKFNTKADFFYSEEDDSLVQDWAQWVGMWCWCNPPYFDLEPWVAKAATEAQNGAQIAMLVPASVGANWWKTWVEPYAYISFLNGRLAFMPDKPNWLYPKDCALLLYTPWGFKGHEIWSWKAEMEVK